MKHLSVPIDLETFVNGISPRELIDLYGVEFFIKEMYMNEIISQLDTDEILDYIGDEKIKEFLSSNSSVQAAS